MVNNKISTILTFSVVANNLDDIACDSITGQVI